MRVLVCGDREWSDVTTIERELDAIRNELERPEPMFIIHGACRGADQIAGEYARRNGCYERAFPADWNTHGKKAGPIRNRQMLREGKPDLVLAFHNNIAASKGTKDMISAAQAAHVRVKLVPTEPR